MGSLIRLVFYHPYNFIASYIISYYWDFINDLALLILL